MLIVVVDVAVVPEAIEAFKAETKKNADASRLESGIARFDVLQDLSEPEHFQLIEVYRDADAPAAHKETAHYLHWRAAVEPMMARPRTNLKYDNVSPDDGGF